MAKVMIKNFQNAGDYQILVPRGITLGDIVKNQLQIKQKIIILQNRQIVLKNSISINNDQTIMAYYHNKWDDKNKILITIYQDAKNFTFQYDRSVIIEGAIMTNNNETIIYDNIILETTQLYSSFNVVIKNEIGNADLYIVNKNFQKGSQILITVYSRNQLTQIQSQNSDVTIFRPKLIKNSVIPIYSKVKSLYDMQLGFNQFVLLSEFGILNTHDMLDQLYGKKNQAILIVIPLPYKETKTQIEVDKILVRFWKFGIFFKEECIKGNQTIGEIVDTNQFIIVISGKIAAQNQTISEFLIDEQKELNITLVDIQLINNNQLQSLEDQEIFHELLLENFLMNVFQKKLKLKTESTPLSPILKFEEVMENNQPPQQIMQ